jgi:protein CpxP
MEMIVTRRFLQQSMLPLAAFALLAVPAAGTLHAQDAQGPPAGARRQQMSPEQQVDRLATQLSLTPDQKTKIMAIYQDNQDKMTAMRNDSSADQSTMRDKMMEMRTAQTTAVKAVLTDDQKAKYDEMMSRQRQRGGGGGQGGGQGAPPPSL